MEDLAITEAPEISTDSSVDASPDISTEVETPETQVETQETQPEQQQNFRLIEGGRLHPKAKQALEKMKTEDPRLGRAIQNALFNEDRFRHELPRGFEELKELRGTLEQYGGPQAIQEVQQEMNGWREFDQMYTSGDPKVLEFLTETPQAQQAFLKIAPIAFDKYRETHPEGYSSYVSQVFAATMDQNELPMTIAQLGWMLKDNPDAMQLVQRINGFVSGIRQMASKTPTPPQIQQAQPDSRASELDQREQQLLKTEWGNESAGKHSQMFNAQWKSQIGDRKLSDTQVATIRELYQLKLQAILNAKPDFKKNLESYFGAKQKDGFMKYFESVYREAVPRALRTAITQLGIGSKPGPKPATNGTQQAVQNGKPAPAANGSGPSGFTFVASKPNISMVNNRWTTPEMWQKGQAILKDGRKVYWKR